MAKFILTVEPGDAGAALALEVPTSGLSVLGRSHEANLRLPAGEAKVSGKHAILEVRGDGVWVTNQSSNGTYIDGERVEVGVLRAGSVLRVGGVDLRLSVEGVVAEPSVLTDVDVVWTSTPVIDQAAVARRSEADGGVGAVDGGGLRTFGDFDVLGELGKGGFGAVYRALHRPTGAQCALKLLLPSKASSVDLVRRFVREQELTRAFVHPHLVGFVAAGEVGGVSFLATELVPGGTLGKLVPCHDLPQVATVAREIFDALAFLHELRVNHRDMKPTNVLLTLPDADGLRHAKVTDMGFGKAFDLGLRTLMVPELTTAGTAGGTLRWCSPEQLHDFRAFQPCVDLYSTAATLYTLLTGETHLETPRPVGELQDRELYQLIMKGPRVPLLSRRPDLVGTPAAELDALLTADATARRATSAARLRDAWSTV